MKKNNQTLITSILVAAILIAGALVYLGTQLNKADSSNPVDVDVDLGAEIQKGIESFVEEQQKKAAGAQAAADQSAIVEGDFTDDDPFMGEEDAPVVLIEWLDFQCPFCRKFYNDTLPQLKEKYVDSGKLKIVFRDFPLSFHKLALPSAIAAECAREQGDDDTYFAYHDLIFDTQNKLGQGTVSLPMDDFKQFAADLGLDTNRFNECFDSEKYKDEVMKDFADGQKAGVRGTPGFLLNGRSISGAQPFAVFEAAIEEELNK